MQRRLQLLLGATPFVPSLAFAAAPGPAALMLPGANPDTLIAFSAVTSVAAITFGGLALLSMVRSRASARTVNAIGGAIAKLELGEQPQAAPQSRGKVGQGA